MYFEIIEIQSLIIQGARILQKDNSSYNGSYKVRTAHTTVPTTYTIYGNAGVIEFHFALYPQTAILHQEEYFQV